MEIKLPKAEILPISALHNMSIQLILPKILKWLPKIERQRPVD